MASPPNPSSFTAGAPNRRSLRDRLRDGIQIPFQAKSRSVDQPPLPTSNTFHLGNPFADMDLLSRVRGSSISAPPTTQSIQQLSQQVLPPLQQQPVPVQKEDQKKFIESMNYVVKENDTITSIAASFDVTPSELSKYNKINNRLIFPGQILKIPPKDNSPQQQNVTDTVTPTNSPVKAATTPNNSEIHQRKFIKINVRHITDGNGVVCGVLLVTPNAVMFDPNVSDPLVLDQGAECYGVILPLDIIVHAGIYSDIAYMRVKGKNFVPPGPKPDLYPSGTETEDIVTVTANEVTSATRLLTSSLEEGIQHDSGFETGRPSPSLNVTAESESNTDESRKQKVLKRLSFPLTWMESLGSSNNLPSSKEETQSAPPESKINYRSLVSLDDMPYLFASFDKLMPKGKNPSEDHPPWYLCLTMGKPISKPLRPGLIVSYGQKKSVMPEYWFSIPRDQVDDLYKFWMLWWPHLYGELDAKIIETRGYELVNYDTELFASEESSVSTPTKNSGNLELQPPPSPSAINELTKESWEMIKAPYAKLYTFIRSQTLLSGTEEDFPEVVSMSEELRRALYGSEEFIPELIGISEILQEEDVKNLSQHLTARAEGYPWLLLFSSSRDGFSLNSLYRKMQGVESPVLIVIEDTTNRMFGGLVSCSLRVSDHFYGTGQSFLFTCRPEFQVFKWTGENMYFIKGNNESLAIGAGDGKFGLWLDGDLNVGRSDHTATYNNPPLVEDSDFVIKAIECWSFGRN